MKKIFTIIIYIFAFIGFALVAVYAAIQFGLTKTPGTIDLQHDYFKNASASNTPAWATGDEWSVLKYAVTKDAPVINKAAADAGVSPRLIVSALIVEQLRLFFSDREVFKSIFAPLKILGNQSQFSWGVMGIKQNTAIQIENNLTNTNSPWFIDSVHAHLLDYSTTTTDKDTERFTRLTDEHDRYYSYLYGALDLKELMSQWQRVGMPISNRPEILATLFNIGFQHSEPNSDPKSGGAEITLDSTTLSFGELAGQFYYSDELTDVFPR